MLFWDKRVLELGVMETDVFSISCLFRNGEDGFQLMFSGVYDPVVSSRKEMFWEELEGCKRYLGWALVYQGDLMLFVPRVRPTGEAEFPCQFLSLLRSFMILA